MRLPWEPASAALAALVLAASLAWLAGTERGIAAPSGSGRAVVVAADAVRMPTIGRIELFDVNDANPFVPWRERDPSRTQSGGGGSAPPGPPPHVPLPPAPPRDLPPARIGGGDAPRPLGFVRAGGEAAALQVRLPDEARARLMRPGETAGRWTFLAIEAGNIAVFADPDGRHYRLVIAAP